MKLAVEGSGGGEETLCDLEFGCKVLKYLTSFCSISASQVGP